MGNAFVRLCKRFSNPSQRDCERTYYSGAATLVAENKDANSWHTSTKVEAPKTKIF